MKVDAEDELRWERPPLPKDLGGIPDVRMFWTSTPDRRNDQQGMEEHKKTGWSLGCCEFWASADQPISR